jgi:hypothetical protein
MISKSKSIKVEYVRGTAYKNEKGQFHREDGPAIIYKDGSRQWWNNGYLHRIDGPAVIDTQDAYEYTEWRINGLRIKIY